MQGPHEVATDSGRGLALCRNKPRACVYSLRSSDEAIRPRARSGVRRRGAVSSKVWLIGRPVTEGVKRLAVLVRVPKLFVYPEKQNGPRGAAGRLPLALSQAGLKITPDSEPVARVAYLIRGVKRATRRQIVVLSDVLTCSEDRATHVPRLKTPVRFCRQGGGTVENRLKRQGWRGAARSFCELLHRHDCGRADIGARLARSI